MTGWCSSLRRPRGGRRFLKLSGLADPDKVADFYHTSEGKIGRVMNRIIDAALTLLSLQ